MKTGYPTKTQVEVMRRVRDKSPRSPPAMLTHSFLYFNVSDAVARCWGKNWEQDKISVLNELVLCFSNIESNVITMEDKQNRPSPNEQTFLFVGLRLSNQSCPNTLPTFPCNVYHNIDCKPFTSSPLHDCTMCSLLKLRKLILDKNISSQLIYKLFGTM